jgi:hypothetical protein
MSVYDEVLGSDDRMIAPRPDITTVTLSSHHLVSRVTIINLYDTNL